MDTIITRRRALSVPVVSRIVAPSCPSESDVEHLSTSTSPQDNLTLSITPLPVSSHEVIFCCATPTPLRLRNISFQDDQQLQDFFDHSRGLPIGISLKLHPHIIQVTTVEPTESPDADGTYQGTTRYFGIAKSETTSINEDKSNPTSDGSKLEYKEIYPTHHLLRSFNPTVTLGLKCDVHGGTWFEVAVLRDCDGQSDLQPCGSPISSGVSNEETDGDEQTAADSLDQPLECSDSTFTDNKLDSTGSGSETRKTETQRKNEKRRANKENRRRDNERRREQRRKATAARTGIVITEAEPTVEGQGEGEGTRWEADGGQSNGWWIVV